jgi:putative ABC transport system permease protein
MSWRELISHFKTSVFGRNELEDELDDELRDHIDRETAKHIEAGVSPEDARRRARVDFGGVDQIKEDVRDISRFMWIETALQDIRFAFRMLRKNIGFTTVAVMTLALGIGANTAVFSVVYGVLLRPLPYAEPDRLVWIRETNASRSGTASLPNFFDLQQQNRSFQSMAAYGSGAAPMTGAGDPENVTLTLDTGELFNILGVQPELGRALNKQDQGTGHDHVIVLSHALWMRRFGGNPAAIGTAIKLDGEEYYIVGVMPASFRFPLVSTDAYIPLVVPPNVTTQRGAHYLDVIGRLKDGVTLPQASADAAAISCALAVQYPRTNENVTFTLTPLRDAWVGSTRTALWVLLGAVAFVVLIASTNVANLLLARASGRHRELAVRGALGASRSRIVRQLLTEGLTLSLLGATLGVLLAYWGLRFMIAAGPQDLPRIADVRLDGAVLGYTSVVALFTTLLFALFPALRLTSAPLVSALTAGSRSAGERGEPRLRALLMAGEIALAVCLLSGAGLLLRSFAKLQAVDPGLDATNVLTFTALPASTRYADTATLNVFYDRLLTELAAQPGVQQVGAIVGLPFSGTSFYSTYDLDGVPQEHSAVQVRAATPSYFQALKIPLLKGRAFTDSDRADGAKVVILNQAAAQKLMPGVDPIGHHFRFGARFGTERMSGNVVGIVADTREFGQTAEAPAMAYVPFAQTPTSGTSIVIRTSTPPLSVVSSVRNAITRVDKDLPLADLATLEQLMSTTVAQQKFYATLLSIFAGLALLMASVGVYGVISYSASQRTQEIGIRIALGAQSSSILRMILRQGLASVLGGLAVGLVCTLLLARLISTMLFNLPPHDPTTLATSAGLLVAVALFACYVPARRATRVDPMAAIREE